MTDREQITHCEAYRSARTLFDYCNGRTCRICIFAEKVNGEYVILLDDVEMCRCQDTEIAFEVIKWCWSKWLKEKHTE